MRFVGRGHPAVRATHDKTLEISPDPEITERGTCIVAVSGQVDDARALAGRVRITVTAGGHAFTFDAVANPGWDPSGRAVVRRSPVRRPDTFASESTATAADLPADLVAALQDPAAEVVVDVDRIPGPPTVVLIALGGAPDPRITAELAAADLLVAEDDAAGALIGERTTHGAVTVHGRVAVAAVDDLPGTTVVGDLGRVRVETVGLPPVFAAAAASPSRAELTILPAGADLRAALRRAPAGGRVVLQLPADRVAAALDVAQMVLGQHHAVVTRADRPPHRLAAGDVLPGRDPVALCVTVSADGDTPVDPAVRAAVRALLADAVPTKAVARALAELTGWDRRRAYDAVLAWSRDAAT